MKVYYEMAQIISEISYNKKDAEITQARDDTLKDIKKAEMSGKAYQNIKPHTKYAEKGGKIRKYAAKYAKDSRAAMRSAAENYKKGAQPRSFEPRPDPSDPYDEHRVYYDMACMISEIALNPEDQETSDARSRVSKFSKNTERVNKVLGKSKLYSQGADSKRVKTVTKAVDNLEKYALTKYPEDVPKSMRPIPAPPKKSK